MKKVSLLFVALMLAFTVAQSQEKAKSSGDVFGKKSSAINLGIGFGNTIYGGYNMAWPTISVSYEYGIVEIGMGSKLKGVISVGGLAGFGGSKKDYGWGEVSTNYFLLAVRGNYHFIFHDKFDPYAGIITGYYFGNYKYDYAPGHSNWNYNENSNGFHIGAYAGARWFFTPNFAVFSELGWNISIFTIGATLKF
ncbi:MAG: hypothetical protein DRI97_00205 [Bacteroidetes bacterium]|nr:MAG: hypothetical protein DRI83_10830 [Bacteroidota bacterium]RLD59794.1 MAG: hypothetical protein DRI97_00205 [Bacteroidota bacterium]RLD81622.1 MAG: hypothetical protein DRJ15_03865 [Bacteroidota bacterium]